MPTRPAGQLIAQEIKIVGYNEEATDEAKDQNDRSKRQWDIVFNISESPDSKWQELFCKLWRSSPLAGNRVAFGETELTVTCTVRILENLLKALRDTIDKTNAAHAAWVVDEERKKKDHH